MGYDAGVDAGPFNWGLAYMEGWTLCSDRTNGQLKVDKLEGLFDQKGVGKRGFGLSLHVIFVMGGWTF